MTDTVSLPIPTDPAEAEVLGNLLTRAGEHEMAARAYAAASAGFKAAASSTKAAKAAEKADPAPERTVNEEASTAIRASMFAGVADPINQTLTATLNPSTKG